MAEKELRKAHCAKCKDERNCDIEAKYEQKGGDENFQWSRDWYILKCRGCDNIFVQTASTNSEDVIEIDLPDGNWESEYSETLQYWPAISQRSPPDWVKEYNLSISTDNLLDVAIEEVYGALNSGLPMLAAIGIRTVFDVAAVQLGAKESATFSEKVNQLVAIGSITGADKERIMQLVDAGGASAHRGWVPSQKELTAMMDILEHFIELSIVAPKRKEKLDADAKALKAKIPPRKK